MVSCVNTWCHVPLEVSFYSHQTSWLFMDTIDGRCLFIFIFCFPPFFPNMPYLQIFHWTPHFSFFSFVPLHSSSLLSFLFIVTTLTLVSWPRQGLVKVWAMKPISHISCFWECRKMWGNEPPHSQVSSHFGNWSLNGLLNLQKTIKKVKNHWIDEFLISLKIS